MGIVVFMVNMYRKTIVLALCVLVLFTPLASQSVSPEKSMENTTGLWLGTYTKYKISDNWFYYGEYHYRRRNQFIKDMAQIYLRFGATYRHSDEFEITGGIVTPIYWAPNQDAPNIDKVVMQYRFWEQFLFVQHLERSKIYHQLRFEQRWARKYTVGSSFNLTHRFRYKFSTYIPLNNHYLTPGTYFASLYDEIFIQAGPSVTYNYLEDNRLFMGLGYVVNENIQLQAGYMWTFRHAGSPYKYEHRHIPRISFYHSLDLSKSIKPYRQLPELPEF